MSAYFGGTGNSGSASLGFAYFHRCYGDDLHGRAPWLITLPSMLMLCAWGVSDNYLQARAVIDDFGDLVAVEPWL